MSDKYFWRETGYASVLIMAAGIKIHLLNKKKAVDFSTAFYGSGDSIKNRCESYTHHNLTLGLHTSKTGS